MRCSLYRGANLPSFAECILGCHLSLYRYARSLCGQPSDAEELVQETYRRALSAQRKPEPGSSDEIRPWMFTILRNIWQNRRRQLSRCGEVVSDLDRIASEDSAEAAVAHRQLVSELKAALDSLQVEWREVIIMRDIEEMTYAQIAEILGCPVGTVMSRLSRARTALRHIMAPRHLEVRR